MKFISLDLQDYFHTSIKNRSLMKLKWVLGLFSFIVEKDYEDEFIKIDGLNFYIKDNDDLLLITNNYTDAILDFGDNIEITNEILPNVTGKLKTTVGRVFMNTIINTYCFNNKIPFINNMFTLADIEDTYIEKLLMKTDNKDYITMEEYLKFLTVRKYIDTLTNYLTIGVTEHSLVKAPGMDKFKKEKLKELEIKYNESPLETPMGIVELEKALIDFDVEYLKNDPTYGKMVTKKVVNVSRKRMYGVYGIGNNVSGTSDPILLSLSSGYTKDPRTLTAMFNDVRGGSFSRGNETKDTGVLTKYLTRSTADVVISSDDCKTTLYLKEVILKDDSDEYIGKYIKNSNGLLELTTTNITNFIGKEVELRDPLYCKSPTGLCITCAGSRMKGYENTTALTAIDLGGFTLTLSLKKIHSTSLKLTKISIEDIL